MSAVGSKIVPTAVHVPDVGQLTAARDRSLETDPPMVTGSLMDGTWTAALAPVLPTLAVTMTVATIVVCRRTVSRERANLTGREYRRAEANSGMQG